MTLRKLDKSEWHAYCDRLSKDLVGSRSGSATVSLAVNHEAIAEWVPLLGIAYEPKKDLFEIILQDLEHWVHHPQTFTRTRDREGWPGSRSSMLRVCGTLYRYSSRSNLPGWPRNSGAGLGRPVD